MRRTGWRGHAKDESGQVQRPVRLNSCLAGDERSLIDDGRRKPKAFLSRACGTRQRLQNGSPFTSRRHDEPPVRPLMSARRCNPIPLDSFERRIRIATPIADRGPASFVGDETGQFGAPSDYERRAEDHHPTDHSDLMHAVPRHAATGRDHRATACLLWTSLPQSSARRQTGT
jgi:hypothetical protein